MPPVAGDLLEGLRGKGVQHIGSMVTAAIDIGSTLGQHGHRRHRHWVDIGAALAALTFCWISVFCLHYLGMVAMILTAEAEEVQFGFDIWITIGSLANVTVFGTLALFLILYTRNEVEMVGVLEGAP